MLKKPEILLIFLILIYGCTTREVEPPSDPRSNFTPPTSPEIVITNMQFAIAEKNLNNYMLCFPDSSFNSNRFRYTADVQSQIQFPIFSSWSLNNERIYYTNMLSFTDISSTSNFFISNEQMINSIDSAIYDADYLLAFNHSRTGVPTSVKGKLRFTLTTDTRNLWSISTWTDIKNQSTDTTWSYLKASFSN